MAPTDMCLQETDALNREIRELNRRIDELTTKLDHVDVELMVRPERTFLGHAFKMFAISSIVIALTARLLLYVSSPLPSEQQKALFITGVTAMLVALFGQFFYDRWLVTRRLVIWPKRVQHLIVQVERSTGIYVPPAKESRIRNTVLHHRILRALLTTACLFPFLIWSLGAVEVGPLSNPHFGMDALRYRIMVSWVLTLMMALGVVVLSMPEEGEYGLSALSSSPGKRSTSKEKAKYLKEVLTEPTNWGSSSSESPLTSAADAPQAHSRR